MPCQDLLAQHGPAYTLNLRVFYDLQRTITGWPGSVLSALSPRMPLKRTLLRRGVGRSIGMFFASVNCADFRYAAGPSRYSFQLSGARRCCCSSVTLTGHEGTLRPP